ncbi:MAG: hypothetical protein Q8M15_12155 [Bacteroidota bacterium]|nr:hypothetical protein [Bacteroidota bacterium]
MENPRFNNRIFWDVNFEQIDYLAKAGFVIERVFNRGDVEDIRQCRRFYGDEKIKEVLTQAKWLNKKTVYLACAVLDNQLEDYRCYNLAQSNPEHWNY